MKALTTILASFLLLSCTKERMGMVQSLRGAKQSATTAQRPKISVQLLLNLMEGPENTADGCVIMYDNAWSTRVGNEDSYKFTNLDENLAIDEGGTLLSIEGKRLTNNDVTILKTWTFRQSSYFLKVTASNFPAGYKGSIYDNYLKASVPFNLSGSTIVSFDASEDYPYRYTLHVTK